jgi:sulfofructose kinase
MFDVLGVGANSVDHVNLLPAYPSPSGSAAKMRILQQAQFCGGQTATALAACAGFGLRAKYVGITGTDENGCRVRRELARRRVDLSDAVIRDVPNQFAVILIDRTGERIVLWGRDERLRLRESELPAEAIGAARVVHVDDVDEEAAIRAACLGRSAGAIVTSDIDRVTDHTAELVAAVGIPIFAEHVPPELTGASDPETALRKLQTPATPLLCVTLGPSGALAVDGEDVHYVPAFRVEARDTTGAGDVFRGGFIYATLQGWAIADRLRFANAAAAISCTRLGAMDSIPDLQEVLTLLREAEGIGF